MDGTILTLSQRLDELCGEKAHQEEELKKEKMRSHESEQMTMGLKQYIWHQRQVEDEWKKELIELQHTIMELNSWYSSLKTHYDELREYEQDKERGDKYIEMYNYKSFQMGVLLHQCQQGVTKAKDMRRNAQQIRQNVVPIDEQRQKILTFLDEAIDQYDQLQAFFKHSQKMDGDLVFV